MKNKIKVISKKDFSTWIITANLFAKNHEFVDNALLEFNSCPPYIRKKARKAINIYSSEYKSFLIIK